METSMPRRPTPRTAYAILQVDPEASAQVVRAAYHTLARRYHPDGTNPDQARMSEINRAHDLVKTPALRARYELVGRPGLDECPGSAWPTPWAAARPVAGRTIDSPVIDFGRYEGRSVREVAGIDPDYLLWLSRHSSGLRYRAAILRFVGGREVGRRAEAIAL